MTFTYKLLSTDHIHNTAVYKFESLVDLTTLELDMATVRSEHSDKPMIGHMCDGVLSATQEIQITFTPEGRPDKVALMGRIQEEGNAAMEGALHWVSEIRKLLAPAPALDLEDVFDLPTAG